MIWIPSIHQEGKDLFLDFFLDTDIYDEGKPVGHADFVEEFRPKLISEYVEDCIVGEHVEEVMLHLLDTRRTKSVRP